MEHIRSKMSRIAQMVSKRTKRVVKGESKLQALRLLQEQVKQFRESRQEGSGDSHLFLPDSLDQVLQQHL